MKKILRPSLIIIISFLCFYSTSYLLILGFCKSYGSNKQFQFGKSQLSFENISPSLGFSKIGIKLNGIKEEVKNFYIIHKNQLLIEVNPFTFNIYIKYNGTGVISSKIDNKQYKIDAHTILSLNLKYSIKIFTLLYEKKLFELINFISRSSLDQKYVSILDENSSEIFKSQNSNALLLTKHDYYTNFDELKHSPPKFYSLSATLNTNNNQRIKFPISVAYGMIPPFEINGSVFFELDSRKDKFNIHSPLDDASVRFVSNNLTSSYLDINSTTEADFKQHEIFIDSASKITFKEALVKKSLATYLNNHFLNSLSPNTNITSLINSITKRADYILSNTPYEIKIKTLSNIADNYINTKIDHIIIKTEGNEGVMANGHGKISANLGPAIDYSLDVNLIVTNAKNVINFWTKMLYPFLYEKNTDDSESEIYNQEVNFLAAKKISDFPTSKSEDLMFRIKIDSDKQTFLISDKPVSNLLETYYRTKYEALIKNAATKKDPVNYINKIAPELSNITNELLKNIPKNIKIDKTLWKKLVE